MMHSQLYPTQPIVLVDDEALFLQSAEFALVSEGLTHVITCKDSRNLMPLLAKQQASLVVLDMNMPYLSGADLLPLLAQEHSDVPVIVVTGLNEVAVAVACMKSGASDYLTKPVDDHVLVTRVQQLIEMGEVRNENARLKAHLLTDRLDSPDAFSAIVTQSPPMRSIFQYIEAIAQTPMPVLITGETGVGKELIARALHSLSERTGQFVPVDVAGIDHSLLSDTLFGHMRGAFTNAEGTRRGLIEQAAGGTLFLDEIGDLAPESQVKLLRVLQDGTYYPVGSDVPKLSRAGIVLATNQDVDSLQESGKFRRDLYYRLQTHRIHIPPLRDRREDIPLLVDHFLGKSSDALGKAKPTAPRELSTLLSTYSFPGNVRELESMVFDAVSRHVSGILSTETFRQKLHQGLSTVPSLPGSAACGPDDSQLAFPDPLPTLKEAEQQLIEEALHRADGNQTIAAQLLGLSRRALNNRLKRSEEPQ